MDNNLESLNNILFEQIERVNDDSLDEKGLDKAIKKAETITKLAKTIIDNANTALSAQKHFDEYNGDIKIANPLLEVKG